MTKSNKHGRIAFITTPKFREASNRDVADFVYAHIYELSVSYDIIVTARTGKLIGGLLSAELDDGIRALIAKSMGLSELKETDVDRWRTTVGGSLKEARAGFQGMIYVTYELVEQRLDAVIHFTDWEDKSGKPDSAVLSREANVHNVPIAHDPETARAHLKAWKRRLVTADTSPVFVKRVQPSPQPLAGLQKTHNVLAMIAHDNKKLELCRFVIENATHILTTYDFVLATGTTGVWIRRFLQAAGRGATELEKIRICNSGPMGGDIQIAYAVVEGICQKIIFLQDASVSHPHDSDIRLFEQAVLSRDVKVELATNVESARLLIGT